MLLGDIVRRDAKLYGEKIGLIDGEKHFTYREINNRVNRLSNGFLGLGLEKGSRVAVMADNCHEFVEAYFALAKAGLVIVPLSTRLSPGELSYIIDHSDSSALIYHHEFQKDIDEIRKNIPQVRYFLCIGKTPKKAEDDYE